MSSDAHVLPGMPALTPEHIAMLQRFCAEHRVTAEELTTLLGPRELEYRLACARLTCGMWTGSVHDRYACVTRSS